MPDHDSSYRKFFSSPLMVRDLISGFVKEDWVKELNFDVMEPVETSFISDGLKKREADVIWRIQWRERWLYVYVLIEMQSTVDSMMAVRLLNYVSLLYQEIVTRDELPKGQRLPPVLPITIYNGKKPWTAATRLADLVEPVSSALRRYQPQFEYFLLDEGRLSPEMAPTFPNVVAALIELENSKSPEALAAVLEHLIGWLEQDSAEHRRLRRIFTVWLCNTLLPNRFEGETFTEIGDILEVKTMLSETVDEWTKKWREEGMEQGVQLGRLKGLEEGLEKGIEQGLEKGRNMACLDNARKMLAEGLAEEMVARITDLPIDEIERLKSGH